MRYTEKDRSFFLQSADMLAPQLLGKLLCHQLPGGEILRLRITETEAYCRDDTACHSYKGKTKANASMFKIGGTAYVFHCHGWQFNVICNDIGIGEGVLIRGAGGYNGPVKLARAMKIEKEGIDGTDLLDPGSVIWLEDDGGTPPDYETDIRKLGENKSADDYARKAKWRFLSK